MAYKLPSKVKDSDSGRNFAYIDKVDQYLIIVLH